MQEAIKYEEAVKLLEEYGVYGAKKGDSGKFQATPGEFRAESIEVRDTTPLPYRVLQTVEPRATPQFLPCLFGFEPWCWVRKWKDPVIDFVCHAIEVSRADIYLLSGRVTGILKTEFKNNSKEGETWEENVRTGEKRNHRVVKGSADLSGVFDESVLLKKINEILAEVKKRTIDRTKPKMSIKIESAFEKKGYLNMIKTILKLLLTGTIYVDDTVKVTVEYEWRGVTRKVSKEFKVRAYLPVKEVKWHMW